MKARICIVLGLTVIITGVVLPGNFYSILPGLCDVLYSRAASDRDDQSGNKDYIFEEIDPLYYKTDVESLIRIKNKHDIGMKREELIKYIWKGRGFPYSKMPEEVEKGIENLDLMLFGCGELENLKSIDRFTVSMDMGLKSVIYFFHPVKSINKLIIYQQGHSDKYMTEESTLPVAIRKGYSVMTLLMPLLGINNKPIVDLPEFGKMRIASHNQLIMLKSDYLSPVKFFMEPVAAAVNYAQMYLKFNSVFMMGISGGGWTTTLYSALDTRIQKSYPVAGTLPLFLRIQRDWGDYEQYEPELYRIANYPELYILGTAGESRNQLQVLNKYDSCCFAGIKYRVYEKAIKDAASRLGNGVFDIYLDDSHKNHKISEAALQIILKDMENKR